MRSRLWITTLVLSIAWVAVPALAAPAEPARCYPASVLFPDVVTRLEGNINADGRIDTVITRARWADASTCRAILIVRTDRRTVRTPIQPLTGLLIAPPGLAGLINLSHRHGPAIGVVVWQGASTGFMDVYALQGKRLERLSTTPFAYAGSVVQRSGVDCTHTHGAVLVASSAVFHVEDNRYHVTRDLFALRGRTLRSRPSLQQRFRVRLGQLARFPEFASASPFPSCTEVPGTS